MSISNISPPPARNFPRRSSTRTGASALSKRILTPSSAAPSYINYDLWIGPAPFHPYNSAYFKGGCLHWNMHWDFGSGQVGDMGSHTMDLAWNAIEAGLPTSAEGKGDPFNPEVTPVKLETHFDIPANGWRDAIKVSWYQGGALPESPHPSIDLNKIGHGVVFEGSSGALVADFSSRFLMPQGNENDLTYYKPRGKAEQLDRKSTRLNSSHQIISYAVFCLK